MSLSLGVLGVVKYGGPGCTELRTFWTAKDAKSPQWIIDALTAMHATFPEGQLLRYRSSTNNEDLPGFNGVGLYDSYTQKPNTQKPNTQKLNTQKPKETVEDGIDKSLKQVFARLWTFRAFTEREFHNCDDTLWATRDWI